MKLSLSFCQTVKEKGWLELYLVLDMTMAEKSYEHHVWVVSNVILSAWKENVVIQVIYLLRFQLFYYHSWQVSDLSALSKSLRDLLHHIQILCLSWSESSLELLSHCALNLNWFDMCYLIIQHVALKNFLEINMKTLCSVGFHDVRFTEMNQLKTKFPELSPKLFCSMLEMAPSFILYSTVGCSCLPIWKQGWRVLLNHNDYLQCLIPPPVKRKFTEI